MSRKILYYECIQCSGPLFAKKDIYGAVPEGGHILVDIKKCTTNVIPYFGEIFCVCNNKIDGIPKIIGMDIARKYFHWVRFNESDIKLNKVAYKLSK